MAVLTALLLVLGVTAGAADQLESSSGEVVPIEYLIKRGAENLGIRLMCQLDSRNCGAFNMGKKFGGYSWLRSADSTRHRVEFYLANRRAARQRMLPLGPDDYFLRPAIN